MELPPTHTEGFHTEESVRGIRYRQLGKTDMMVGCVNLGKIIFFSICHIGCLQVNMIYLCSKVVGFTRNSLEGDA